MKPATIRRLLSVLLAFGEPCTAAEFAEAAYASSKAWKRSRKIVASAAGILGRLRSRGFVERSGDRYRVSERGHAFLGGKQPEEPTRAPSSVLASARIPSAGWVAAPTAPGGLLWFDGLWGWWCPNGFGGWWPWAPFDPTGGV